MDQLVVHLVPIQALQVGQRRQRVLLQAMAVMLLQRPPIRDDPGFHAGGHEEDLLIRGSDRLVALVTVLQMVPGSFQIPHWIFAIDEHRNVVAHLAKGVGGLEIIENRSASTASAESRHLSRKSRFLE